MDFSDGWNYESLLRSATGIMTRVLKRPMFRLGGNTDQGIMSGVVPRQGYQGTNNPADQRVISEFEK